MARYRTANPPEFRRRMVDLARSGTHAERTGVSPMGAYPSAASTPLPPAIAGQQDGLRSTRRCLPRYRPDNRD